MKTGFTIILVLTLITLSLRLPHNTGTEPRNLIQEIEEPRISVSATPSPSQSPSPSPTPRLLTRGEMEKLYGPCIVMPVLYYHHIEPSQKAYKNKHTSLFVDTQNFSAQMQALIAQGYESISPDRLISFFDTNQSLPAKPIMVTFDDGYEDFYTDAYPILKQYNIYSTVFLPTGLVNNKDYLTWDTINEIKSSGLVYFGNHTWSHKSMQVQSQNGVTFEVGAAETQLRENGLNKSKVFGYPYGAYSEVANNYLLQNGYKLAFGTKRGTLICKGQRYFLPRVGVGNSSRLPAF